MREKKGKRREGEDGLQLEDFRGVLIPNLAFSLPKTTFFAPFVCYRTLLLRVV